MNVSRMKKIITLLSCGEFFGRGKGMCENIWKLITPTAKYLSSAGSALKQETRKGILLFLCPGLQPVHCPIPAGCHSEFLFKQFYKIVGIQNPNLFADLMDGKLGADQPPI